MKKLFRTILFAALLSASYSTVNATNTTKTCQPEKVAVSSPIPLLNPLMLDSIDLNGKKFTNENLLSAPVNFGSQSQFTTLLTPDTAGYFTLQRPQAGKAFYLAAFFVNSNGYGKAKLKITSPQRFELYIDDKKEADKKTAEDSLKNVKAVETPLNGILNARHIVLKFMVEAESKLTPAFKVEIIPEATDSITFYSFDLNGLRRLTIEDILIGKRVSSVSVSPGGRFVLMRFSSTNETGKTQQSIEIFDTKQNRTVLAENAFRNQPGWMPQSDLLRYFEDADGGRNLYTLDPATNATHLLARNLPKENYTFSPDGKTLYYSSKEVLGAKSPKGLKRILAPDDRQNGYRNRYYIQQYQFESGLSQPLTFGQHTASIKDISRDGRYLLFSTRDEDLSERPFDKNSLFRLDLQTMTTDTLWYNERFAGNAQFSPDAKQILITGGPEAFGSIGSNIKPGQIANSYDTQAFIMDAATRVIDPITRYFDPAIEACWWSAADNNIYFRVEEKDCENIYRYTPRTRKYEKLPLKEELISSFSLADNRLTAAYAGSSTSNSRRAYTLDLKKMESHLIADPYAERLSKLTLGKVTNWNFTSSNGDLIEGRFYLPPHFDPAKKYPLIVYYYGGTSPTKRTFESTFPLNLYAAMGYVVYTLQPSGTTGFGQEFSARHVNAWGDLTANEIIEGTRKFIAAHPFVIGDKVGCIGASYGGFMTQYLLTQTDLFAAAISHAGISSIASYWGEGYWGYSYSAGASAGSYPWNNRDLYINHSPLFNADKVHTPLLLLHGSADTNVPPGESIQMFTALKLLGRPVELVLVEGENHAIYDFEKRIEWNHTIFAWFARWLKGNTNWWDDLYPEK